MDSIFKISKKGLCGITVTGLELDNDEYLNEDNVLISTRNYTYTQSVTINVLKSINAQQEETVRDTKVVLHKVDCIDESDFEMEVDGLHSIIHIILPTQDWLNNVLTHSPESLDSYYGVYFYNTNTNTYMKYENGQSVLTSLEEILEINALPPASINDLTTTIIKNSKSTFCLCKIRDCFYQICRKLLEAYPVKCPDKSDDIATWQYYRDILWMAINTIKYLLEKEQFYEAQRILQEINYCGSICGNTAKKVNSSCGCSQR